MPGPRSRLPLRRPTRAELAAGERAAGVDHGGPRLGSAPGADALGRRARVCRESTGGIPPVGACALSTVRWPEQAAGPAWGTAPSGVATARTSASPRGWRSGRVDIGSTQASREEVALTQQPSKWARPSPTIRVGVLGLFAAFLLVLPLALAPRGEAYIYWATLGNSIGRANLDGTNARSQFHPRRRSGGRRGRRRATSTGRTSTRSAAPTSTAQTRTRDSSPAPSVPSGVAVDADHVYWTNRRHGTDRPRQPRWHRGRQSFITGASEPVRRRGRRRPRLLDELRRTNSIGRANLDGTGVDQSFIAGATRAAGVAVDASHVYWTKHLGHDRPRQPRRHRASTRASSASPASPMASRSTPGTSTGRTSSSTRSAAPTSTARTSTRASSAAPAPRMASRSTPSRTRLAGRATAEQTQRQRARRSSSRSRSGPGELTAKATGKIKVNPTYKLKPKKVQVAAGKTKTLKLRPKKAKARKIATALKRGEKAKAKASR